MKKIIALIFTCAMLTMLFVSCSATPEPLILDHLKVTHVFTSPTGQELDIVAFVDAFNTAKVTGKASATNLPEDVIVYTCTDIGAVAAYVAGENEFIACSNNNETVYSFTSEQLYTLFKAAVEE